MRGLILAAVMAWPAQATETADPTPAPPTEPVWESADIVDRLPVFGLRLTQPSQGHYEILNVVVEPGNRVDMRWRSPQSYGGFATLAPISVLHGPQPGPTMCLTGAIHGDELNGIEIVRRVAAAIDPMLLRGTVIAMPIVNVEGFHRRDRYIGDRRDLNRAFPGKPDGSYAQRVAHALLQDIILRCDALVDVHTGSFYRENLPQVRGELAHDPVAALAGSFGGMSVLNSSAPGGSLRSAAVAADIPAVVLEVGVALILDIEQVETAAQGILVMLRRTAMLPRRETHPDPLPAFFQSGWLRTDHDGILISKVSLGDLVQVDQVVAEVINPLTNQSHDLLAPMTGTVLGLAQNQFVSPGFAIMRIGQRRTLNELESDAQANPDIDQP